MQAYDHGSYVERAIVTRSCAYCFEGPNLHIRCQGSAIEDAAPAAYWFAIGTDLFLVQCREVLLNCRVGACSIIHEDLQRRKLIVIMRPVIAAKHDPQPGQ